MFARPGSTLFVPDGVPPARALERTTHLGIGAHSDDLEILAIHGILACFDTDERWFCGAVVTDGVGSPQGAQPLDVRTLRQVRREEQERAAALGRYGAVAFLDYASADVKHGATAKVVDDLVTLLRATRPEVLYTHALTDAHDTHVAVALRVVAACRALPEAERPARILGCEVWRDLDWLTAVDKIALPTDDRPSLQRELIECFGSQLRTKGFDRAVLGRRAAHAAFAATHDSDRHAGLVYATDLTPLVARAVDAADYACEQVRRLEADVVARIARLRG